MPVDTGDEQPLAAALVKQHGAGLDASLSAGQYHDAVGRVGVVNTPEDEGLLDNEQVRDTAATVYFASRTRTWSNVYRNGFVLKEDVDPVALQQAVDDVYPAAKYYFEHGAHGFFWDYLERDENTRVVVPEDNYPCRPVDIFNTTKPMMRIVWHKRRIAMECFHGICDGTASMLLVKTIVARYLELKGVEIPDKSEFIDLDAPAAPEELEDAYQRHYAPMKGLTRKEASAWQIKGTAD